MSSLRKQGPIRRVVNKPASARCLSKSGGYGSLLSQGRHRGLSPHFLTRMHGVPQHREAGSQHDAVHDQAKHVRLELQDETLGDEGAEHERGARYQSPQRDLRNERAKMLERRRLAEIE